MSGRFFPVVVCSAHDSPLDALLAMHVAQDEAADAVAAALFTAVDPPPGFAVLAEVDGGRAVAAVHTADGRWAAGNAFPEQGGATYAVAERTLSRVVKRGRHSLVAHL